MRATRTALWKNEAVPAQEAPEKAKDASQTASSQAAALRHIDFREMPKLVESLVNQREMQAFLSDAYSPYDQLDPVLLSALLREDLAGVVEKCGATEEEFLAEYRAARGLHTTTRENRAAFKKKYVLPSSLLPCTMIKRNKNLKGFLRDIFIYKNTTSGTGPTKYVDALYSITRQIRV